MNTFVISIMLSCLGWATFIFFGGMNILAMPIVWFLYPEVAGRNLEEMNLLFTSESLLVGKNMVEYDRRVAEAGGNIAVAARRLLDEVNGQIDLDPRRVSVISTTEAGEGKMDVDVSHAEEKGQSTDSESG